MFDKFMCEYKSIIIWLQTRVGFFPIKNYFLLSGGKNWKYPEKNGKKKWKKLCLLYLKMNVIKWYHSCNVGWKGKYFVHVNESMTLLITGLQFSSISMICFVHDPYVWIYRWLTQMAPINQVLCGKGHGVCTVPRVEILPIIV